MTSRGILMMTSVLVYRCGGQLTLVYQYDVFFVFIVCIVCRKREKGNGIERSVIVRVGCLLTCWAPEV